MIRFKDWLLFVESAEQKELARRFVSDDNVYNILSSVTSKYKDKPDSMLVLAAYYYTQFKDLGQLTEDLESYFNFVKDKKMPLISLNPATNKPDHPWDLFTYWATIVHTHQGEEGYRQGVKFQAADQDVQGEKPISASLDEKIKLYKTNSVNQCIILGQGQKFCISQPGNKMYQSYRDTQTSSFYFVHDNARNDRLSVVVIDVRPNRIVLTDQLNNTGTTLDPFTNELTTNPDSYIKYLKEKGINVSLLINAPKTAEEVQENEKLGYENHDLNWFVSLSYDEKSKYIGRGHELTDKQFDELWNHNFKSLLNQYVKTGLKLNDYQIDKISTNRDLRDNYTHNRLIAQQHKNNLTKKEYSLLNEKQKQSLYKNLNLYNKMRFASEMNDVELFKDFTSHSSNLTNHDILQFISVSPQPKNIADVLGVHNTNSHDALYLMRDALYPQAMADFLGLEQINQFSDFVVYILIQKSQKPKEMANALGLENWKKIENYNKDCWDMISDSPKQGEVIQLIIDKKKTLTDNEVAAMIRFSSNKNAVAKMILDKGTTLGPLGKSTICQYCHDKEIQNKVDCGKNK